MNVTGEDLRHLPWHEYCLRSFRLVYQRDLYQWAWCKVLAEQRLEFIAARHSKDKDGDEMVDVYDKDTMGH